jgi:hypothetical protein
MGLRRPRLKGSDDDDEDKQDTRNHELHGREVYQRGILVG